MIKYPDEFIDGTKNSIKINGIFNFIKNNFSIVLTYFYMRIRQVFGIRSKMERKKMIENQFLQLLFLPITDLTN